MTRKCTCRPCIYRRITRSANRSYQATVVIDTIKGFLFAAIPFCLIVAWVNGWRPCG